MAALKTIQRASCLLLLLLLASARAGAYEADLRLKWFGSATSLPRHDVLRSSQGARMFDQSADARLMVTGGKSTWRWLVHHSTTALYGDSVALNTAGFDGVPTGDQRRALDLTWSIGGGDRHDVFHRLDRAAIKYRKANFALTVGREAVSWGSGHVFQPMDLFNPFAPTAIDRDFKAGDDLLHAQMLFGNGSDLELLAVARRDGQGDVSASAASYAAKWHGFLGAGEFELMAAKHYLDRVLGATVRLPLGGALLRTDVVATDVRTLGWRTSAVVNIDYSFDVGQKNLYVFAEYYRNGFGVSRVENVAMLPVELQDRIARGEVYALMRHYTALGGTVQWHPLLSQGVTLLSNLEDGSSLVQTAMTFDPGDRQRLEFGVTLPLGRPGDEYGGVAVSRTPEGRLLTTGAGKRIFARWVYYF